jgi:hypothetical protein
MVAGINTTGMGRSAGGIQQLIAALARMGAGQGGGGAMTGPNRGMLPPGQQPAAPPPMTPSDGEALVAAGLAPPPTPAAAPPGAMAGNLLAPPNGGMGAPPGPTPEEQALIARRQAMVDSNNPFGHGFLAQAQQKAAAPERNLLSASR